MVQLSIQLFTDAIPGANSERQVCARYNIDLVFIAESVRIEFLWVWEIFRVMMRTIERKQKCDAFFEFE